MIERNNRSCGHDFISVINKTDERAGGLCAEVRQAQLPPVKVRLWRLGEPQPRWDLRLKLLLAPLSEEVATIQIIAVQPGLVKQQCTLACTCSRAAPKGGSSPPAAAACITSSQAGMC